MALELKGLKAQSLAAARNIDRLNRAYDGFNTAAPAHAADVEGLTPQIEALGEDLQFAAQVLGNSVAASNSGDGEDRHTPVPPLKLPDPPNTESIATASSPAVGQTDKSFR